MAHHNSTNNFEELVRPTKLFVGGLTKTTTTKMMREHFGKYGRVMDCVAMCTPDGKARGFGYCTLHSPEAAHHCISEPQVLDGRSVDVKLAVPGPALAKRQQKQLHMRHQQEVQSQAWAVAAAAYSSMWAPPQAPAPPPMVVALEPATMGEHDLYQSRPYPLEVPYHPVQSSAATWSKPLPGSPLKVEVAGLEDNDDEDSRSNRENQEEPANIVLPKARTAALSAGKLTEASSRRVALGDITNRGLFCEKSVPFQTAGDRIPGTSPWPVVSGSSWGVYEDRTQVPRSHASMVAPPGLGDNSQWQRALFRPL
mmetsp:Transcript_43334/g.92775  ORF Transcript_43334/g.92775 Transcript_43334/m.92775 type:complete len:311 (+) Transcript_43334:398-1330(+)